jgi:quinol-cytochrome oxidoreductase complex cytochrome b subunit
MAPLYALLHNAHFLFSRLGLAAGLVMLVIAVYIGLIRHGDATRTFRRGVYAVIAFMVLQSLIGLGLYGMGFRPSEEVHLIYGLGAVLSLPFFVYVETTARKRPAMGSYLWGFTLLAAIIVRAIMTGVAG